MSTPSSIILAARAVARRMGIANANDPENPAGHLVEPPAAAAPATTPPAAAPESAAVQASSASAPASTTPRASEAL
ncbi:hypothetical protein PF002_g23887 [Phytophthora fragariae]|uniref:Uncharacterized protein n=2 Tax=Phytophthora fragariae TaxID=53985 RepID=A0A6A3DX83_9STRA|nr:hypothetical protein PF003_g17278 [Phytophthora fragariae]KAE8926299.1 hypothetical protein PF009_g23505 [Phytophthora fragariae]KAE9059735.1 hypothetical protein PF006_g31807 [Phytophthora fragariae]KAE9193497.1 hypothetical protein PF002_g23887 [Phytophthora fragariae]